MHFIFTYSDMICWIIFWICIMCSCYGLSRGVSNFYFVSRVFGFEYIWGMHGTRNPSCIGNTKDQHFDFWNNWLESNVRIFIDFAIGLFLGGFKHPYHPLYTPLPVALLIQSLWWLSNCIYSLCTNSSLSASAFLYR